MDGLVKIIEGLFYSFGVIGISAWMLLKWFIIAIVILTVLAFILGLIIPKKKK